jgi:hypothetical protein
MASRSYGSAWSFCVASAKLLSWHFAQPIALESGARVEAIGD